MTEKTPAPSRAAASAIPGAPAALPSAPPKPAASWLAAQGRLPLAFMGLGLGWLLVATAMLATRPELLALPHSHPHVVALAHAWLLGGFVTIACGAVYQLAPVALGTTLASERYGWWQLALHSVGVPIMVVAFHTGDATLLGHGGSFVALGVMLFAAETWRTIRRSGRRGPVAWTLALSAGWLLGTVAAGLLLAANLFWRFLPLDSLALLRAHAHLGLVGFFLTLLQGVSFQLLPMFTLAEVRDWRRIKIGLWCTQLGLVALAPSLVWQHAIPATGAAAIIAGGTLCSAVALRHVLATRRRRSLDTGTNAFLRGGLGVCLAALAGVALACPGVGRGSSPGGFSAMPYAMLAIAGGLLPVIAGMICKIVPFLTWMRAYGPHIGRRPTPVASALAVPVLERWGLWILTFAAVPLVVGAWTLEPAWCRAGAWSLALGMTLLMFNVLAVLRHLLPLTRPAGPTIARSP